uniref:Long-chain-fatty-acid--CoA ligase n=1 Tax=uncultured bacterium contig00102 TaxID=1181569 RepID=A0A806KF03_9BACT|nr:long-chain-fatty-acid--CoA ligase [uncultured bacterium contig00102]
MDINAPWLASYGDVPHSLDYPDCSMAALVLKTAEAYPKHVAYDFFGRKQGYAGFAEEIRLCARGLKALGIERGQRVTICMPNTPQAVIMLYALNLIGAVACMIHPLSAQGEIARYLSGNRSVAALTLDQFAQKLLEVIPGTGVKTLILAGIDDGLGGIAKPLYRLTKGRGIVRRPTGGGVMRYADLMRLGRGHRVDGGEGGAGNAGNAGDEGGAHDSPPALRHDDCDAQTRGGDVAVILYSGGTSGATKGILLTNLNFNALAMQTMASGDCVEAGRKMLAIMPVFHGFGLGVCIHTAFISGVEAILVPQFSIHSYAQLLAKHKPHYIAGVPTLYSALLRLDNIHKLDMSQLMGVFSGGDSLSVELKRKVDAFLRERGASVQVREGYGLTECVTASCLTPRDFHKEGSIGIPYPDTFYKIVRRDTTEEAPYGEEGEITISGPTVMKSYDGDDEETARALRRHADGRTWLHTGDLGAMDEDGFVYFRQRIKRMIISSGYSIYPSQIENVLESHENVLISCVIGVPDEYKVQRLKAFVVLRGGAEPTDEIKASIKEHCKRNIAKYAMPSEFEYRADLPRTLVGKVAYIELEKEELLRSNV